MYLFKVWMTWFYSPSTPPNLHPSRKLSFSYDFVKKYLPKRFYLVRKAQIFSNLKHTYTHIHNMYRLVYFILLCKETKYIFFKIRTTQLFFLSSGSRINLRFQTQVQSKGKKIKTDFLACEIAKFHPKMLAEKFQKLLV